MYSICSLLIDLRSKWNTMHESTWIESILGNEFVLLIGFITHVASAPSSLGHFPPFHLLRCLCTVVCVLAKLS